MAHSRVAFCLFVKPIFVWRLEVDLHVNQTQFDPEDDLVSKTFGVLTSLTFFSLVNRNHF